MRRKTTITQRVFRRTHAPLVLQMLRPDKRRRRILAYRQTDQTMIESRITPNASEPIAHRPGAFQQSTSTLKVSAAVQRYYPWDDVFGSRTCRFLSIRSSRPLTASQPV